MGRGPVPYKIYFVCEIQVPQVAQNKRLNKPFILILSACQRPASAEPQSYGGQVLFYYLNKVEK